MDNKKVVVITGVSKGFGKAFAEKFKQEGFFVVGISRTKPDFQIDLHILTDLTNISERKNIIQKIIKQTTKIDVFINNAGITIYNKFSDTKEDELRKLMELNFFTPVALSKEVLPYLEKSNGTLINISSVAAMIHMPFMWAYCSSKSALNGLSNTLRAELCKSNVHVLNVMPGRINTGFSKRAMGTENPPETPFASCPEKLANKVFKGYKCKKREIVFPKFYKYILPIFKAMNGLYDRISYNKWNNN